MRASWHTHSRAKACQQTLLRQLPPVEAFLNRGALLPPIPALQCVGERHDLVTAARRRMNAIRRALWGLAVLACALTLALAQEAPQAEASASLDTVKASQEGICGCACENDLVEQLLGVVARAAEQYEALAERYMRLKHHGAVRAAVLAFPLELSVAVGLISIVLSSRLAASRARRRSNTQLEKLREALHQRTVQWEVSARETTDLAALLQQHTQQARTAALKQEQQQQQQGVHGTAAAPAAAACQPAGDGVVADACEGPRRQTAPWAVRESMSFVWACCGDSVVTV